ncbi:signal transduction histidine kinase [Kribbella sp. VKM Ac-2569]|nr:signal transduction histidine kinase [Kribbella sp. VKM Ac-2569]
MSKVDAIQAAPPPPLSRWQSTWRYLFAIITGAGFWITSYYNTYAGQIGALWAIDLLLGVVSVVLMRRRRTNPFVVALIVNIFGSFSTAASGAVVVTTVSLATRRRWHEIVPVAVVGFAASVVFFETHPGAEDSLLFSLLFTVVFVSAVIAPGMYVGARRDLLSTLRERADRAEREQGLRVEQAQVTERARIAREMHDALAHRLSLVALHAGALEYCRSLSDAEVAEAAAITRKSAHLALQDLHAILGVLRTLETDAPPERPQPTLADLPALVQEAIGSGTRVRLHNQVDNLAEPPDAIGRGAYRMIQESLTNARKHAPDTAVDVTLSGHPGGQLVLEVRNPLRLGSAVSLTPGSGLGLLGLTERAELIGGRLEHLRLDGHFVVRAWLPWPA